MSDTPLQTTPLHALHLELGARMVPFAGYDMPVQYPLGVMKEHRHTRAQAGLFDVSHMGQIRLTGADAAKALETLVPVDIIDLPVGMQRYALFTNEQGGILDDLMVANLGNDTLMLVVNAACKDQDLAHLQQHLSGRCTIEALFDSRALLALQACVCTAMTWTAIPRPSRPACSGPFPKRAAPTVYVPGASRVQRSSSRSNAKVLHASASACCLRNAPPYARALPS